MIWLDLVSRLLHASRLRGAPRAPHARVGEIRIFAHESKRRWDRPCLDCLRAISLGWVGVELGKKDPDLKIAIEKLSGLRSVLLDRSANMREKLTCRLRHFQGCSTVCCAVSRDKLLFGSKRVQTRRVSLETCVLILAAASGREAGAAHARAVDAAGAQERVAERERHDLRHNSHFYKDPLVI